MKVRSGPTYFPSLEIIHLGGLTFEVVLTSASGRQVRHTVAVSDGSVIEARVDTWIADVLRETMPS